MWSGWKYRNLTSKSTAPQKLFPPVQMEGNPAALSFCPSLRPYCVNTLNVYWPRPVFKTSPSFIFFTALSCDPSSMKIKNNTRNNNKNNSKLFHPSIKSLAQSFRFRSRRLTLHNEIVLNAYSIKRENYSQFKKTSLLRSLIQQQSTINHGKIFTLTFRLQFLHARFDFAFPKCTWLTALCCVLKILESASS